MRMELVVALQGSETQVLHGDLRGLIFKVGKQLFA